MWEASTAVYLGVVKRLKKFGEWFKLTIRLALARQKESTNHNEYAAVYGIRMRYIYKLFKRCCKTYIKEIQGRPTPDVKFYWKKNKFIRGFKNYCCLYFALFGELTRPTCNSTSRTFLHALLYLSVHRSTNYWMESLAVSRIDGPLWYDRKT